MNLKLVRLRPILAPNSRGCSHIRNLGLSEWEQKYVDVHTSELIKSSHLQDFDIAPLQDTLSEKVDDNRRGKMNQSSAIGRHITRILEKELGNKKLKSNRARRAIPGVYRFSLMEDLSVNDTIALFKHRKSISNDMFYNQQQQSASALRGFGYLDMADQVTSIKGDHGGSWKKACEIISGPIASELHKDLKSITFTHKVPLDLVLILAYLKKNPQEMENIRENMSKFRMAPETSRFQLQLSNYLDILVHRNVCQALLGDPEAWIFHLNTALPLSLRLTAFKDIGYSHEEAIAHYRSPRCVVERKFKNLNEFIQKQTLDYSNDKNRAPKDRRLKILLRSTPKSHLIHKFTFHQVSNVFEAMQDDMKYTNCDDRKKLELVAYQLLQNAGDDENEEFVVDEIFEDTNIKCQDISENIEEILKDENPSFVSNSPDDFTEKKYRDFNFENQAGFGSNSMAWYQKSHLGEDIYRQSARLLSTSYKSKPLRRSFSTNTVDLSWMHTPRFLKKFRVFRATYNFKALVDRKFDEKEFLEGCKVVRYNVSFKLVLLV